MSDSDSDIAFESADEGEELQHSSLRVSKISNSDVSIEALNSSNQQNNAETEKYKTYKKERTEYDYTSTQETNICNTDMLNYIEETVDSNRKICNGNDEKFKIVQDSNKNDLADQIAEKVTESEDLLKSKYTEDACITEKQSEEDSLNEDKLETPECLLKFDEKQSAYKNTSNSEKQNKLTMKSLNKSKTEKEERIVLKFEKKLSEKNKNKSAAELENKKQEQVLNTSKEQQTSSWGWGNWSSSLLSTAASSVSAFTSQVSEGFGTVLETVESTLGAPPPEELAAAVERKKDITNHETTVTNESEKVGTVKVDESLDALPTEEFSAAIKSEKKEINNCNEVKVTNENETLMQTQENPSGLFDGVSSLSRVIENAGSKVLMTGLDTLELIGKTTIDILTEGDPGLRKKRAYFTETTNLSEILREAKDKAETLGNVNASEVKIEETIQYSTLFDNFQGIVHLEALEMLSRQNKTMLQGLLLSQIGEDLSKSKEKVNEIQEICENLPAIDDTFDDESHHEFLSLIKDYISKLELDLSTSKLEEIHRNMHDWLKTCKQEQDKGEVKDAMELYHEALTSLAKLTAGSMELFHKVAEMIMYKSPDIISALSCSSFLIDITGVLCFEVGIVAAKFCQCLNTAADDSEDPDSIAPVITNVYLEASNSNTYIQDAFLLLVPILQVVAIKQIE